MPFSAERDGGKRELGAILQTGFRGERLDNLNLQPRRSIFMGTKRLKMTRRVNLLHKVSTFHSAVPAGDADL